MKLLWVISIFNIIFRLLWDNIISEIRNHIYATIPFKSSAFLFLILAWDKEKKHSKIRPTELKNIDIMS